MNEKTLGMTDEMTNDETGELAEVTVIGGLHTDAPGERPSPMPPDVRERALLMARGDFNVDTAIGDPRAAATAAAGL